MWRLGAGQPVQHRGSLLGMTLRYFRAAFELTRVERFDCSCAPLSRGYQASGLAARDTLRLTAKQKINF